MTPHWRSLCVAVALLLFAATGTLPPDASASPVAIALIRPLGGEIVPGGLQYTIDWYAQHDNDPRLWVTIRLSTDGGATYPYFVNADYVPGGPMSHPWAVPNVDTTTARVRVCATAQDGDAGCAASLGDFTIRGVAPFLSVLSPPDGAHEVPLDETIYVAANSVNTLTVGWNILPNLTLTDVWNGATSLELSHTMPFSPCTLYTIVLNGFSTTGNPLGSSSTFLTECPRPFIVSTSPPDGARDVNLDAPIVITFSAPMNPLSVIVNTTPVLTFMWNWSGSDTILTLNHTAPFDACTAYAVQVPRGEDANGYWLLIGPTNNAWSFMTMCPYPYIASTDPADDEIGVPFNALLWINFSESVNNSTFNLTSVPPMAFNFTWSDQNRTVEATHPVLFEPCASLTFTAWAEDLDGNPLVPGLVPNPWTFTTRCAGPYVVSTDPSNGTAGVPLDANIVVTFSEPMNTTTVLWTIVPFVPLTDGWNTPTDTVLTLSHTVPFAVCTTYTVWIVAGLSKSGQPLVLGPVPSTWSFSTGCPSPFVVSTDPSNGTAGVPLDANIVVTFSEPMNTTTVTWTITPTVALTGNWSTAGAILNLSHAMPFLSCRAYTVHVTAGKSKTGSDLIPGPVPNPWTFTTICSLPSIMNTDPPDGASEVARDAPIVVTFSRAMNDTNVSVTVTPALTGLGYSWNTAKDVLTVTHDTFAACTAYQVEVAGSDIDGNPLVPGPVPNPWTFDADCVPVYVSMTLTSPLGGESWTGGALHPVGYSITNVGGRTRVLTVSAMHAYGGGGGAIASKSETVGPSSTVSGRFDWTVPPIDATDVVVNVTATDAFGDAVWTESAPFEIDSTVPQATTASPQGAHAPMDPTVVVAFSEPLRIPTGSPLAVTPPVASTITWPAADRMEAALSGTQPCTSYAVEVGTPATARLTDDSDPGNALAPLAWSFRTVCSPSVSVATPSGGEDWSGGSTHGISWTTADADDATLDVSFFLSSDGGAAYAPLMPPTLFAVGAQTVDWPFPRLDTANAVLRVDVTDGDGNTATALSGRFTVDSTPPAILVSYPSNGSFGHKTTREIWFVWTERVDRASVESAFSIAPNPGGIAFSWSVSNLGGDVLVVNHAPFHANTPYVVTFGTAAKDDSVPGNALGAPLTVTFTTQPPPNVNPPVAKAVGKNQAPVGVPVRFDGTQSTGNITAYVWRIVDNQGRFIAALVGPIVNHTFWDHGRYSVTLTVTDANGLSDEDTLEVNVTSNPNLAGYILAGGALLAAALAFSTEAGRTAVFSWLLVPLYARRKRNELLEHQTRGMIMGYIMVHPGDTYTDIKRNLQLTNGTLSYHLAVLEREGFVSSQVRGVHKLFFPRGVRPLEDGGGLHEVQLRMLGAIREVPGLAVKDLAGAIGITSQHALYHLRALASKGKIRFERHGVRLRCYPEESAASPKMPLDGHGPAG